MQSPLPPSTHTHTHPGHVKIKVTDLEFSRNKMCSIRRAILSGDRSCYIWQWFCFALCKLNTLQNILMILGRNAEQDETWFHVSSVTWIPFGIFWWCLVENRTGWDDVLRKRMTTLPFSLLALPPYVIFDSDYVLISCMLCKLNTLWNILMILSSNEEPDQTTCHIQEWQLWLFFTFGVISPSCVWIWFLVSAL